MGQVNRVDSAKLAVERANTLADSAERARGSVAASDAFFPFADGLQVLIDAGVSAVVQPGGSIRDEEVVAAAEAAGITMYFTVPVTSRTKSFPHYFRGQTWCRENSESFRTNVAKDPRTQADIELVVRGRIVELVHARILRPF